jgi:hypothetical protein
MNKLAAILLVALSVATATAQVLPPPPGSTWTVAVSQVMPEAKRENDAAAKDDAKPEKSVFPEKLVMRRGTNGVIAGIQYSSNGTKEEFFVADGYVFYMAANSDRVLSVPLSRSEMDPLSLKVGGFPGLSWISPETFRGIVVENNVECRHYTAKIFYGGPEMPPTTFEAWLRKSDGHPVACRINDEVFFTYGEVTPFPEAVVLPDSHQEALRKRQNELAVLDAIRRANERNSSARP